MGVNDPLTQHELKARAHEALDRIVEGHARSGYFGEVGVVVEIRDGNVVRVRAVVEQVIKN